MANRITTLFDLDSKGFDDGLKKLRRSVGEAEGVMGKLRVAGSGVANLLKVNIASAAAAGGVALAVFAAKAVAEFEAVALAAGKFADATGIAVEDASRWIEVAGDVGVSGDAIQGAMAKMAKAIAIGGKEFDKLGLAVVRFADGSVDASSTFVNALSQIEAITDPTQKALAATKLFGKGYAEIAELTGMRADELRAKLAAVGDAQVIDKTELEKARKFRERMDDLGDSFGAVQMELGERLVPALIDVADATLSVVEVVSDVDDAMESVSGSGVLDNLTAGFRGLAEVLSSYKSDSLEEGLLRLADGAITAGLGWIPILGGYAEDLIPTIKFVDTATSELAETQAHAADLAEYYQIRMQGISEETIAAQQALEDYSAALKGETAFLDVVDQMGDLSIAAEDASTSFNDQRRDLNKTKQSVIDYAASVGDIPPESVTKILALLDEGKFRAAADALAALAKPRSTTLSIPASIAWRNDKRAGLTADHAERNAVGDAAKAGQDLANQIADAFKKGASKGGGGGGGGGGGSTVRTPAEVMADWDAVVANLVELGEWDAAQYRAYLQDRLGQYVKYSDDYMRVAGELRALDEADAAKAKQAIEDAAKAKADQIAQEQAKVDAMYELGEISRDDYRAQLADRLKSTEKYSSDYMRIIREIAGIDKEVGAEKKAAEDEAAKAEQDRLDAEKKASEDAKRAAEEAQRAQDDALNRAAMQSIVAANIGGATYATINTAADPNAVINAIQQYERRNGPGWRA